MTDVEEEYWDSTVVLEIRTDDGGTFIRVPKTPSLEDLYETVTYTESKVDEFLTKFLKEN